MILLFFFCVCYYSFSFLLCCGPIWIWSIDEILQTTERGATDRTKGIRKLECFFVRAFAQYYVDAERRANIFDILKNVFVRQICTFSVAECRVHWHRSLTDSRRPSLKMRIQICLERNAGQVFFLSLTIFDPEKSQTVKHARGLLHSSLPSSTLKIWSHLRILSLCATCRQECWSDFHERCVTIRTLCVLDVLRLRLLTFFLSQKFAIQIFYIYVCVCVLSLCNAPGEKRGLSRCLSDVYIFFFSFHSIS